MKNLLVRNVPKSDLSIQRARYEVLVIPWVESQGCDKINVLEDTQTLLAADVPQPDCLVHAAGQDEEVLGPGHIQQITGMPSIGDKWPVHEYVAPGLRICQILFSSLIMDQLVFCNPLMFCLVPPPHIIKE